MSFRCDKCGEMDHRHPYRNCDEAVSFALPLDLVDTEPTLEMGEAKKKTVSIQDLLVKVVALQKKSCDCNCQSNTLNAVMHQKHCRYRQLCELAEGIMLLGANQLVIDGLLTCVGKVAMADVVYIRVAEGVELRDYVDMALYARKV